jgi:SAM-dependent methyltransferase
MSAAHEQYALGRSPQEYARLARQAEIMKPMTRRLFAEAGLQPGMRVLDLGSGAGDVCMLLAEMVGLGGTVIGLDLDEDAMLHARARAAAAGLANITFVHSDFAHYVPDAPLDAIVGRLVLMYQADPAVALAKLTTYLRPGGVVAFIEPWFQSPPGPDSTLKTAITCLVETLRRSGAQVDLGPRLHRVFQAAGLPLPNMRFEAVMDPHEESPLYELVADTIAHPRCRRSRRCIHCQAHARGDERRWLCHAGRTHGLRLVLEHGVNRRKVVEDPAVVVGGWVRDVDDIDAGEPFLGLGLRALDRGRRFVDVDRFLDFL